MKNQDDNRAESINVLLMLMNKDEASIVRLGVSHSNWKGQSVKVEV